MSNSVITLEDFVKYHELSSEAISEEFVVGTTKQKVSIRLPMINGHRGLREIIAHIWNFNVVIQCKVLTEDNMKSLFAASLTGNTHIKWNTVAYPAVVREEDPRTFRSAAEALVALYVQGNQNARYDLLAYLRQIKKPQNIDTISFQMYIKNINSAAEWFSGSATLLNTEDFKSAFFNTMPRAWRERFTTASCRVQNISLNEISSYMRIQELIDTDRNSRQGPGKKRKNRQGEDDDTKPSAKPNTDAGGRRRGNPKKGRGNKPSKRPETERHQPFSVPKPQDPCPFHNGLHVWGKCFENKHNTETPPTRHPAASSETRTRPPTPSPRSEAHSANDVNERWGSQRAARKTVTFAEAHAAQESVTATASVVAERSKNSLPKVCACSSTPLTHHLDDLCYQGMVGATSQEDVSDAAVAAALTMTSGLTTSMVFELTTDNSMDCEISAESPPAKPTSTTSSSTTPSETIPTNLQPQSKIAMEAMGVCAASEPEELTATPDCFEEYLEYLNEVTVSVVENFFLDLQVDSVDVELHDLYHESSRVMHVTSAHEFSTFIDDILSPCTILLVNKIQGQAFNRPLRVLFDSGSDFSHIQKRVLPPGVEAMSVNKAIIGVTGSATVAEEVELQDMVLPEFSHTLHINNTFRCYVMNNASIYDVILGRDFLMAVGIDVLHSTQEMKWMDLRLPFRRRDSLEDPFDLNTTCLETLAADVDDLEPFSIMDAKYEAVDPRQVAEAQTHLSPSATTTPIHAFTGLTHPS